MKKFRKIVLLAVVFLTACGGAASNQQAVAPGRTELVTVFKPPTWGCCGDWSDYLEENGFTVKVEETQNLGELKARYQVPPELQSCHTAIVDGYVIEGHVPVAEIERLLTERPDIIGIAVAGMPAWSPGMEIEGFDADPYNVVSFDKTGATTIFASYPKPTQ